MAFWKEILVSEGPPVVGVVDCGGGLLLLLLGLLHWGETFHYDGTLGYCVLEYIKRKWKLCCCRTQWSTLFYEVVKLLLLGLNNFCILENVKKVCKKVTFLILTKSLHSKTNSWSRSRVLRRMTKRKHVKSAGSCTVQHLGGHLQQITADQMIKTMPLCPNWPQIWHPYHHTSLLIEWLWKPQNFVTLANLWL